MNDLKFALRQLLKNPGFTAVAVLTLALGIGVNTSMFSHLQSLLLPDLPYPDSGRLVRIFYTSQHSQRWPHSPNDFMVQREQSTVFEGVAATSYRSFNLSEPDRPAERVRAAMATSDLLPLVGVAPQIGRAFLPEEDQIGRNDVVVLNHDFWVRRFSADPKIIGRTLRLDGESVTVVGVMPADFRTRQEWSTVDLLRPMAFSEEERRGRGNHYLDVVARLKPDISLAQGNAALETLAARLRREHPDTNADGGFRLVSLASAQMDPRGHVMLWLIMGLAGFVLLIACANLANLQFARTALRTKELAIRGALGAQRGRLVRQLLTENLLLAAVGGAVGLLLADWTNYWLARELTQDGRPLLTSAMNLGVLGFALMISTVSAFAFGLLPALLASRTDLNTVLKQGTRGGGSAPQRVQSGLIISQVALALMLLTSAGLVISGLQQFGAADPGWRIDGLSAGYLNLPEGKYPDSERRNAFVSLLQNRLAALPGVERAAVANGLPVSGYGSHTRFTVEGETSSESPKLRSLNFVSPEYFATLGIGVVEGREFNVDDVVGHPEVVIVNRALAHTYWPNSSALGRRIGSPGAWLEIVGVVEDVRSAADAGEPTTRFQSYRPLRQEPQSKLAIAVRGTVSADTLRQAVADLDPDLPLSGAGSVRATVDRFLGQASVAGWVLGLFAALGLFLAALGTYGVIAGFVNQRTNEIGVRMALGAQIRDVLCLVLGKGLRLTVAGVSLGLLGAFGLARGLASFAPGLKADQPMVFLAVSGLLVVVAFVACWIPARRASRVDPMKALRID
jgi:putative ABC transport system permease protein